MIPSDVPRSNYGIQCESVAATKKTFPQLEIPQSQVLQPIVPYPEISGNSQIFLG